MGTLIFPGLFAEETTSVQSHIQRIGQEMAPSEMVKAIYKFTDFFFFSLQAGY